jgi:hypothetical protein
MRLKCHDRGRCSTIETSRHQNWRVLHQRETVTFNVVYAVWALHDRRAAALGGGHGELDADSSYSSIPEIAHRSTKRAGAGPQAGAAEPMTTESAAFAMRCFCSTK